jgi:phenylacetate-coenzyme A ligase PaaK-like adenylate-forming protein
MSQITGRRDDMLVIRGVNIYPSEVERVLLEHPSVSPDYLLVVDERGDSPELVALCEHRSPVAGQPAGQEELEVRLRAALGARVRVRVLPGGTVPRSEVGKAVRVVRWADGEPPVPGLG